MKQLKLHRLIVTLQVFNGKSVQQKRDPQVSQLLPILSTSSFNELLPLDEQFYEVFAETKTGKDQQYVAIMFNRIRSTDKSTLLKLCHSADYFLLQAMCMIRPSWRSRGKQYTEYGVQIKCVRQDQTGMVSQWLPLCVYWSILGCFSDDINLDNL